MGLFGEKCARCESERADGEYEGVPTCEGCREAIEAKLRAGRETRRTCPVDDSEMTKEVLLNIVIDRCPTCSGVWLDRGELESMKRMIEAGLTTDLLRGMTYPF
jgi:hypothetical protein